MRIQEARQEEKDSKEKGEKEPIQVALYQKNSVHARIRGKQAANIVHNVPNDNNDKQIKPNLHQNKCVR